LFRETNPAPVKFALNLFDLMAPRVRLPLVEIVEKTKSELTGIVARLCNDWSVSMIGRIDKPVGAWRQAS
jgi:dihydrodipicolinate synthase/N-acetylneuraminate lyase